jgi:hypothetical protein
MVPGRAWRVPVYWPGGVRYVGGASLICGFCMERGKAGADTGIPLQSWEGCREEERRAAETVSR